MPDSSLTICTDATGTGGVGIFVHGTALWASPATSAAYFIDAFDTSCADAQVWELAALVMLVEGFGTQLAERGVRAITWRTDSSSAQSALNRAAHRNANCLRLLRRVGATLHRLDIAVCAVHVAGDTNVLPDCLSRWHEPGKQAEFARASAAWSVANSTSVHVQEWSTWLSGQSCNSSS
jgi:ribonuclease HI